MIIHHPYETLGGANHGWLQAKHHFSFARYHDPKKMSHGELLVINDDRIAPHTGFDAHPHQDMEIITFVRKGAITHQDNQGNKGRTSAGNIQVMSAGTGIYHSEYNLEDEETNIFQIWIIPNKKGVKPRWDTAEFPKQPTAKKLQLLVSGDGKAPLQIHQDARIYAGLLAAGTELVHPVRGKAYLLVSQGCVSLGKMRGNKGDGFALSGERQMQLLAHEQSEILVIEVPGKIRAR